MFTISWSIFPLQDFPAYFLSARPGADPRVEHLKGASFRLALACLANNRLALKGLPGTNTLAYYAHL